MEEFSWRLCQRCDNEVAEVKIVRNMKNKSLSSFPKISFLILNSSLNNLLCF